MTPTDSRRATPSPMTIAGLAAFVLAYAFLVAAGDTEIVRSADPGASGVSLWAVALPPLAALALARLVTPAREVPSPLAALPETRVRREAWTLVAAALLLALVLPLGDVLYLPAKLLLLLAVPLLAFRLTRGDGHRARTFPAPVTWIAPLPAVLAWFVLSQVWPFASPLTQDLPDPVTLAVASLVTFLTASVLEEVFYRSWLQTRLEVLYGRWPAIMASALLFALMHSARIEAGAPLHGLAAIVANQGLFGLMLGYLWARYRNLWVIVLVHTVTNLVYVPMLIERL
ncbi:CPBP family intramembrane glutamic endopeptidase [Actinomadura viridis]|uniref:Membrane protease YdiL (CAAX protease family) n=1 Tax=Actinomadura viridis TaxID=58110 RepID=A0A931DQW0_9ACTN|nr:CPBP family intramembrane glutamic endopeptidase [Actinomadura viridis]MBG6092141.1 membrane protease YdiL (CAAX protease family) [Actinomadura viridis]